MQTDLENGISINTLEERSKIYGTNRKKQIKPKGFFELARQTLEDFTLRLLIVAGIASIIINTIMEEGNKKIGWIEGFAILLAVFIIVVVTVINDMKKEKEFQKLNEAAESSKKISVIRDGKEIDDMKLTDVLVGDLVHLKAGMEIAGDGILIEGFTLTVDESSMTGETRATSKNSLAKCLEKKHALEKQGIENLSHHAISSVTDVWNKGFDWKWYHDCY